MPEATAGLSPGSWGRLLVYLDDFLIMAHTREQCLEQAQLIVGLLDKLDYLINREKSVLEPTQRLEYLGFLIDTVEMKFFLPEMKILKIQNLAEKFLSEQISARQLASLLGLLQATLPAITIAPLYFRNLQRDLSKALNSSEGKQSYRTVVVLSLESRGGELMWWKNWLPFHNRKNILVPKEQETSFLRCLKEGLGSSFAPLRNRRMLVFGRANPAHKCSRTSSDFFSNKSLATQNRQATSSVCNRQPNCSNIMNKLSKTHSHQLSLLAIELWHFALKMNLTLSAVYVPGIKNCIADRKSRVFNDSLKWMLNLQVFQQMLLKMHGIKVHLFASRINHQLTAFVSWRPEPGAMACDAFNLNWGLMKGYLLSPFCLIHRCKKRIQQDQAECILITQVWKSRPCYPVILSLLVDRPLLLPKDRKLLQLPGTDKVDPLRSQKNFHLAAWPLSGKKYQNRSFLLKCQRYLQASWRQKTTCQYESAWKAWSCWCDQRQVDPSSTSSNVILEFLAELLHKGYKYRTIGVYRSTISNFHHPIDGIVIGKHPLMSKFKKGVYSMCPLEPKYFVTQDVNQVLSFLKTWAPVEKLTLKQLTLKLVTLAALTSAARSSSVYKMDLCFRQLKSSGIS